MQWINNEIRLYFTWNSYKFSISGHEMELNYLSTLNLLKYESGTFLQRPFFSKKYHVIYRGTLLSSGLTQFWLLLTGSMLGVVGKKDDRIFLVMMNSWCLPLATAPLQVATI